MLDVLEGVFEDGHEDVGTLMVLRVEAQVGDVGYYFLFCLVGEVWAFEPLFCHARSEEFGFEPILFVAIASRIVAITHWCFKLLGIKPSLLC